MFLLHGEGEKTSRQYILYLFLKLSFHAHPSEQVPLTLAVLRLPQPFKPKALASLHHTETCIPVQILALSYLQPYNKRSCNPAHLGTLCYHFNTWVT